MTSISDSDLTDDAFLGGQLQLLQPRQGYRAGIDPVLLAACVPASAGQSLLDLGCGVGTAMLCAAARVPGLIPTGVEMMDDYAALARRNLSRNTITGTVHTADLRTLPPEVTSRQFDHVIANPPYFDRASGTAASDAGRNTAFSGDTPLHDWVTTASRRTAPKGTLTIIQRAERLPELLAALPSVMGSTVVLPLSGRAGRTPDRVILQAQHSGRAGFTLLAPLVLHSGDRHGQDAPDYTPIVDSLLRNATQLPLSC